MSSESYHFPKKTIRDIAVHDKKILLRADFNVPLKEDGSIESDYRIVQTLPTLEYLLQRSCTVVIVSHLGRPEGKIEDKYSLAPVADRLRELLPEYKVDFVDSTIDDAAWQASKKMPKGSVLLLENLRFNTGEEANDADFAATLKRVSEADYFVQDGFGVVHRAHASTEAITHQLPSVSGLLLESEVTTLEKVMKHPRHPLVAVIAGAKISDKIGFIEQLLTTADTVLVGGAMANTFLKAQGVEIGKSKYEVNQEQEIATISQKVKSNQLRLPVDVMVSKEIATNSQIFERDLHSVQTDDYILDIGPATIQLFKEQLASANTVLWNGPLGMTEIPAFAKGSAELAWSIADQHHSLTSVVGGGDTADFVLQWLSEHPQAHFGHISTGGGASLELMSGMKLPGLEALIGR